MTYTVQSSAISIKSRDADIIDLLDLAKRLDFIAPKVGNLLGSRVVKVDPHDRIAVSKARAAIKDRHNTWAENKLKTGTGCGDGTAVITVLRITEIERFLRLRYGAVLPNDDAGREDLVILLNHVAHNRTDPDSKMRGYIHYLAPWMPSTESEALIAMILVKPRKYTPATLGRLFRLTEAERDQECITTFRAYDATEESMAENANRKDREYQKVKRDEKRTGRPRGRPTVDIPAWKAAGASSKASYYRNLKAGLSETLIPSEALDTTSYAPEPIKVSPPIERGALQATPSVSDDGAALVASPRPTVMRLGEIPDDGLIIDEHGDQWVPPELLFQERPKRTWWDAAYEGFQPERRS
jgi:hypothetical protein